MWEKILLKGKTSKHAIKLIEEVMDSEPKTLNEILDLIYDKVKKRKKDKEYRSGRISIPTRSELRSYLGKNYNSGFFDKYNNRQLPRKTTHSETRYWKG